MSIDTPAGGAKEKIKPVEAAGTYLENIKKSGETAAKGDWEKSWKDLRALLDVAKKYPKDNKEILAKVGTEPIKLVKDRAEALKTEVKPGEEPKEAALWDSEGFHYITNLIQSFEEAGDSKTADEYIKFALEGIAKKFTGKSKEEIRKALYASGDNAMVYRTLLPLYQRLAKDKKLDPAVAELFAKVMPILDDSDSDKSLKTRGVDRKEYEDTASRFATIDSLKSHFMMDDKTAAKIRSGLDQIKASAAEKAA